MAAGNWKDHPVVLLGGAFAAGLALALTIAIPVYTTSQQNAFDSKVKQIEEKYAKDKADIANIRSLRAENAFLKDQLSSTLVELYALAERKPFLNSTPIPVGFESLQIGESVNTIKSIFPPASVGQTGNYYYVNLDKGVIRSLQIDTAMGKIIDIDYFGEDSPSGEARLLSAATAAFGDPEKVGVTNHGNKIYYWSVGGRRVSVMQNLYTIYK